MSIPLLASRIMAAHAETGEPIESFTDLHKRADLQDVATEYGVTLGQVVYARELVAMLADRA